jgi:hypothetical protein
VSDKSNPAYWRMGIVVDGVLILVGLWMISRGWTDFGEIVVGISVVGLVVSVVQLVRLRRQRPADG